MCVSLSASLVGKGLTMVAIAICVQHHDEDD